MKRSFLSMLLLTLSISGCAVTVTKPMLKIGLVAPFEGLKRPIGYEVLYAVKLAIREHNQAGGVGGHLVELVALNDNDDPLEAIQRAREMIVDPDVRGVIGYFSSVTAAAAADEYHRAGLALISPTASVRVDYAEVFRLYPDNRLLGREAAYYALTELGAQRLAVLRGDDNLADAFITAAEERGGNVVFDAEAGSEGWLTRVVEADPDLMFFSGRALEGAEVVKRLRETGLSTVFMGGSEFSDPQLLQAGGEAVEGAYYVSAVPPWEEDQAFVDGYQALASRPPGPYAILAYDAAHILLEALARIEGHPDRQAVVAALAETKDYRGLMGPITFDATGSLMDPALYLYRLVDGQRQPVQQRTTTR